MSGHKERDYRSGSGGFSEYSEGAFTLFMNGEARCGSKPARWRCRVFFTKERMRHEIPDEPVCRDRTLVLSSASTGPLNNMNASPPTQKAQSPEMSKGPVFN